MCGTPHPLVPTHSEPISYRPAALPPAQQSITPPIQTGSSAPIGGTSATHTAASRTRSADTRPTNETHPAFARQPPDPPLPPSTTTSTTSMPLRREDPCGQGKLEDGTKRPGSGWNPSSLSIRFINESHCSASECRARLTDPRPHPSLLGINPTLQRRPDQYGQTHTLTLPDPSHFSLNIAANINLALYFLQDNTLANCVWHESNDRLDNCITAIYHEQLRSRQWYQSWVPLKAIADCLCNKRAAQWYTASKTRREWTVVGLEEHA